MIPIFPTFKKIDLDDRSLILKHTGSYLPYSDFNFTNLWSWNPSHTHSRMISSLNNNLVILFTDYRTAEPVLSFLGRENTIDTALQLLEYAKEIELCDTLRYITEETAAGLPKNSFEVVEDHENFDYIFSVPELANQYGSKFKTKRHLAHRFMRENPEATYELKDLREKKNHDMILSVFKRWENKKLQDNKSYELKHEEIALKRILDTADAHNLILSGIFLKEEMLGFSIDELLPHNYALSHFLKADTTFKGIYECLNEKVARHLLSLNVESWNWEQDLNLEGLRKLKMSYRPKGFLKKYKVSIS
jgi:hypothetical protein